MSHDILNKNVNFFIPIVCKFLMSLKIILRIIFLKYLFTGILLTKKWLQNFHFVFNQHLQLALAKSIVNYSCDYCMQYTYIHVLLKNILFILLKIFKNNYWLTCLQYMSLHLLHIINKCSCFSNLTFLHIIKTNLYLHVHVCQSHISMCILSYICIYIIRRAISTTPNIL